MISGLVFVMTRNNPYPLSERNGSIKPYGTLNNCGQPASGKNALHNSGPVITKRKATSGIRAQDGQPAPRTSEGTDDSRPNFGQTASSIASRQSAAVNRLKK